MLPPTESPLTDNPAITFLGYIALLAIASFTAFYASKKGRNPFLWFIIGTLIGVFAPLILFFLSQVSNKENPPSDQPGMTVSPPNPLHTESSKMEYTPKYLDEENKLWYYLDQEHQQIGPVSIIALRELWNTGRLNFTSYVWTKGMGEWKKIDEMPELKSALVNPYGFVEKNKS